MVVRSCLNWNKSPGPFAGSKIFYWSTEFRLMLAFCPVNQISDKSRKIKCAASLPCRIGSLHNIADRVHTMVETWSRNVVDHVSNLLTPHRHSAAKVIIQACLSRFEICSSKMIWRVMTFRWWFGRVWGSDTYSFQARGSKRSSDKEIVVKKQKFRLFLAFGLPAGIWGSPRDNSWESSAQSTP